MQRDLAKPISYMLVAALCFTFLNTLVKQVDHLPTFQLVFFRAIGTSLCCFLYLGKYRISPFGNNKRILIIRSLVGLVSISLFFRAIQLMPLASAVSLRYLSPIFATILAILFLGEKLRPLQWLLFITAFAGVVLLKGFDPRISSGAFAIILTSAFFTGMVYFLIRKIGHSEHPVVIVNYFMTISAIAGGTISIFFWSSPEGIEWLMLFSLGFFGFIAQVFMTKALQWGETNLVTPFKYSEVVFTLVAGWVVFGEYQTWIGLLGISIIILSLVGIVWVKARAR